MCDDLHSINDKVVQIYNGGLKAGGSECGGDNKGDGQEVDDYFLQKTFVRQQI